MKGSSGSKRTQLTAMRPRGLMDALGCAPQVFFKPLNGGQTLHTSRRRPFVALWPHPAWPTHKPRILLRLDEV